MNVLTSAHDYISEVKIGIDRFSVQIYTCTCEIDKLKCQFVIVLKFLFPYHVYKAG